MTPQPLSAAALALDGRATAMRARDLYSDCDGAILPYLALMLAVILGLSALALDGSRLMSVQTQLQNGADALALAGAAELDRRPDSIVRAQTAIRQLISNPVPGAGVDQTVQVGAVDFLETLPVSDDQPITSANLTDDPTLAAYVLVTVRPVGLQTIFPVSLIAGRLNISLGAHAVAGYDQVVCNVMPLYVCNPFEVAGMSHYQATQALVQANTDPRSQRRLIRLSGSQVGNAAFSPGSIGYVAAATGFFPASACGPNSAYGIPQALAAPRLRACFRLSGVNLLPGEDRPALDGLNTRFDMYNNGFYNCRIYAPDQNVRKGFVAPGNVNWCNSRPVGPNWPIPYPDATPLPVDSDMMHADGTLDTDREIGNGTWNCAAYWADAHRIGPGKDAPPPGCTTAANISRYQVYNYELNYLTDRSLAGETGGPQCAAPGEANRRVITAAIINCGSTPVPMRNEAQAVPVAGFGRFFLVLPSIPNSSTSYPYAEFLGLIERTDPLSTDLVELNR